MTTDPKERLNLYRETYYHELDRKDRILTSVQMTYTLVVVLLGGLWYFVSRTEDVPVGFRGIVFCASLIVFAVLLGCAVVYLIRAYTDFEYQYVPDSQQVEQHWQAIAEYCQEDPAEGLEADELFVQDLIQRYCEANAWNAKSNKERSDWRSAANRSAIRAAILAAIVVISYALDHVVQVGNLMWSSLVSVIR